jgi:hypothetical protein
MKRTTRIIIISTILVLLIFFILFKISGFVTGSSISEYSYSWTKAICNETHCQDYQIFCNKNQLINQTLITGAIIENPENWTDPRNETIIKRICN